MLLVVVGSALLLIYNFCHLYTNANFLFIFSQNLSKQIKIDLFIIKYTGATSL